MYRLRPFLGLILPIVVLGSTLFSTIAFGQSRVIERVAYARPSLSLTASSGLVSACQGDLAPTTLVLLNARATSPAGNPIRYRWETDGGHIDGAGPSVTWDLAGLVPGYYKANVTINSGSTDGECETFASTSVLVRCSPNPPPVCPTVSIACPDNVSVDEPITFAANLAGGTGNVIPGYTWKVSAGRIIEGQGSSTITVDTKGLAGQSITADLSLTGFPNACPASCVVQIPLPKSTALKFDEFPDIPRNDEKARLDNYAVHLQSDPTATAYVVIHPGVKGKGGSVQKHASRIVEYLVDSRGLDARRVVTVTGSARQELMVELFICPQGASFEPR